MDTNIFKLNVFADGLYIKSTRAHTHRELIREWLCEPKGNSLRYISVFGGGVDAATLRPSYAPIYTSIHTEMHTSYITMNHHYPHWLYLVYQLYAHPLSQAVNVTRAHTHSELI